MMTIKCRELENELALQFPAVDLEFKSAMRDRLISDVLNYKLDAAFVPAPLNNPELEQLKATSRLIWNEYIAARGNCPRVSNRSMIDNSAWSSPVGGMIATESLSWPVGLVNGQYYMMVRPRFKGQHPEKVTSPENHSFTDH